MCQKAGVTATSPASKPLFRHISALHLPHQTQTKHKQHYKSVTKLLHLKMADKAASIPIHPKENPKASDEVPRSTWKPNFDRRQSFSKEDQKRAMHMTTIESVKTGPGFTERKQ